MGDFPRGGEYTKPMNFWWVTFQKGGGITQNCFVLFLKTTEDHAKCFFLFKNSNS